MSKSIRQPSPKKDEEKTAEITPSMCNLCQGPIVGFLQGSIELCKMKMSPS